MVNTTAGSEDNIDEAAGPSNGSLSPSQNASTEDPWSKKCVLSLGMIHHWPLGTLRF
jgi:hypothetical protein